MNTEQQQELGFMPVSTTKTINQVLTKYEIVTDVSRIKDLEIPEVLDWGQGPVRIPRRFQSKDVHFILNAQGQVIKACWINRALGLLLNSQRKDLPSEAVAGQLDQALKQVDLEIGRLLKKDVLTNRRGPGAMSFSQANENVPEDSILISKRTYDALCAFNRGWYTTREVMVVRYPNLGSGTTRKLKLVVNAHPPVEQQVTRIESLQPTQLGARLPILSDLLKSIEQETAEWTNEEQDAETLGLVDCFYVHPKILKGSFEGDGDGDLLYMCRHTRGRPRYCPIDLTRVPGQEESEVWAQMLEKSQRTDRPPLAEYLPRYLDSNLLIAQATYAIRFLFFLTVLRQEPGPDAMFKAWQIVGPYANWLIEFVMDMRKGEHDPQTILDTVLYLKKMAGDIKKAQNSGMWFAKVVTTSQVIDPDKFLESFPTLQHFADYISRDKHVRLSDLQEGLIS